MRVVRWLGIAIAALIAGVAAAFVAARFADGPLGPVPGGPLVRGERVTEAEVDWSFAKDVPEIELQLVEPPRSRTTWLVVHEGVLYVPSGYMRSGWKAWPHQALRDGRVVLRIQGRLFERQAVLVEDPALHGALAAALAAKYELPPGEGASPDELWIFRMDPRP